MNKALGQTVEQIWLEYDKDGNGILDRDEMRLFIRDVLVECGLAKNYNEQDFAKVFQMVDEDGNGTICKKEMFKFVKKISKL